ncbi:hypothetical protein ACIA8R_12890 [Nonomuraea sp. NPDC051191]|uniref:hypothetical protein n=1 Tax=Nonomuraea sp. NPDC051191 TaxID=3364372 RepID=UPI0037B42F80
MSDVSGPGRKRELLRDIVTALVLTPVRWVKGRGYLRHFRGDVGIDTTATPVFARPPQVRRSTGELIASTEITAGWHHSARNGPPEYGYSATLTVAARARSVLGSFPQLALGLVLDTPHKRIGANAITTLKPLPTLGLPAAFAVVDRAYTDQQSAHFAQPARELGYRLALDYKADQLPVWTTPPLAAHRKNSPRSSARESRTCCASNRARTQAAPSASSARQQAPPHR